MKIRVHKLRENPITDHSVEMVEPDTICDDIADEISRKLCKFYLSKYGRILHHNVDKVALKAGEAERNGLKIKIASPMEILVIGRATTRINGEEIDLNPLLEDAVKSVLDNLGINNENETVYVIKNKLGNGSVDLTTNFDGTDDNITIPKANDTSFGVSYAPFSSLEVAVQGTCWLLWELRDKYPIGTDIKVMGVRDGKNAEITIACPVLSDDVKTLEDYFEIINELKNETLEYLTHFRFNSVTVKINNTGKSEGGVYITKTGTSAESGDDGQVGRGNRFNGLITPQRPMSLEADAGKNPVNHIGKIYN